MDNNFTQTSNDPYLRHTYQIIMMNAKTHEFDDYIEARNFWMCRGGEGCDYIKVLDIPVKKTRGGGF